MQLFSQKTNRITKIIAIFSLNCFGHPAFSSGSEPDSSNFLSYSIFKDKLISIINNCKEKVLIISPLLTDGDIATALFAAKIRGLEVMVLLDKNKSHVYLSRHNYLAENKVAIFLRSLQKFYENKQTLLILDKQTFMVNTQLDFKAKNAVAMQSMQISSVEVEGWFKSGKEVPTSPLTTSKSPSKIPTANNPTTSVSESKQSATINTRQRIRALSRKGLPLETRLRLIERGAISFDLPLSNDLGKSLAREPEVSSRESDLP